MTTWNTFVSLFIRPSQKSRSPDQRGLQSRRPNSRTCVLVMHRDSTSLWLVVSVKLWYICIWHYWVSTSSFQEIFHTDGIRDILESVERWMQVGERNILRHKFCSAVMVVKGLEALKFWAFFSSIYHFIISLLFGNAILQQWIFLLINLSLRFAT